MKQALHYLISQKKKLKLSEGKKLNSQVAEPEL